MKKINILLIIGLVLVLGLTIYLNSTPKEVELYENQPAAQEDIFLVINSGQGEPENFKVDFIEGMTAFDVLKSKTDELNIFLKTKSYDMGIFIEAIGDKENGEDGKYWLYYIDGEMPMVSADNQKLGPGAKVEFKFEKSSF